MTDSSVLLDQEITYWINKNANYKRFFERGPIAGSIIICAEVTKSHPERETLIMDFIAGLTLLYLAIGTKSKEQMEQAVVLLKPVSDLIINRTGSSEYRQHIIEAEITGESRIEIRGEIIPITAKAILLHIRRLKAFPLTPKDIAAISRDFKQYTIDQNPEVKKQQYKLEKTFSEYFTAYAPKGLPEALKTAFAKDLVKTLTVLIHTLRHEFGDKPLLIVSAGEMTDFHSSMALYFHPKYIGGRTNYKNDVVYYRKGCEMDIINCSARICAIVQLIDK